MKSKIMKLILSVVALGFTIASMSMIFAWYTNVNKIGEIDANSTDVNITYTINEDSEVNAKSYIISNLAFFDLENEGEIDTLLSMVHPIEIKIKNHDARDKRVTLRYEALKQIKMSDDNVNPSSVAYPIGILSSTNKLNISGITLIKELIPNDSSYKNNEINKYTSNITATVKGNSSISMYVFMIGAQEIKSSDNSFLIENGAVVGYEFKIIVEGVNI